MRTEDLYLIPDPERIAAARWAAIDLLYPVIERRHRRDRFTNPRWPVPVDGWLHTYDSSGGIHSERASA